MKPPLKFEIDLCQCNYQTFKYFVTLCLRMYVHRYMWSIFTMINLEFSTLGGKRKRPKKNLSSSVKRSWDCSRLRILQKNQESIKMQVYPYLRIKIGSFLGLLGPNFFLICHFLAHFTCLFRTDKFIKV